MSRSEQGHRKRPDNSASSSLSEPEHAIIFSGLGLLIPQEGSPYLTGSLGDPLGAGEVLVKVPSGALFPPSFHSPSPLLQARCPHAFDGFPSERVSRQYTTPASLLWT